MIQMKLWSAQPLGVIFLIEFRLLAKPSLSLLCSYISQLLFIWDLNGLLLQCMVDKKIACCNCNHIADPQVS